MLRTIIFIAVIVQFITYTSFRIFQDFTYREVPAKYLKRSLGAESSRIPSSPNNLQEGYDLTNDIVNGDMANSKENTQLIQRRIQEYSVIIFPDFPVYIDEGGLDVESNRTLIFNKNSELKIMPNSKARYEILRIHNKSNISIFSPKIVGDRNEHTGNEGEWGMGIAIRSSKNVNILNAHITKCWGDGIYVGQLGKNYSPSESISIYRPYLDFNRRNGISITSVKGLELCEPLIANTNGILPMCGIDIEPGNSWEVIEDVNINDAVTYNNSKAGIVVNLSKLSEIRENYSSVNILNHVDENSSVGFYVSGINTSKRAGHKLHGSINVKNTHLINNMTAINMGSNLHLLPEINIEGLDVEKNGRKRTLERFLQKTSKAGNINVAN